MSTVTTPPPSGKKLNYIGLESTAYRGAKTTLCAGCGHNAITERIIDSFFELGIQPTDVIKLSGIGCSSKSPAYFLNAAHGSNSVHGRMPSLATGAVVANRKMIAIGVSGDGDTGAIGIGQFVHLMRRNLPIVYVIEDNGCYGLTKGQFSPTADLGSTLKTGVVNDLPPIDTCALAIDQWEYSWQEMFMFKEPISVPKGSTVKLSCTWNNELDQPLTWGEGTNAEMCVSFAYVTVD